MFLNQIKKNIMDNTDSNFYEKNYQYYFLHCVTFN